jgi:AAA domain
VCRELRDNVVVVPEVATHLLGGFFPSIADAEERRAVQRAIYHVQLELEAVHRGRASENTVLVFDRGLVDGAAYWPDGCEAFFTALSLDAKSARERYDAVVFLESAAAGGLPILGDNPARSESRAEAARVDADLRKVWATHPEFRFVAHTPRFETKVANALGELRRLIHGE